MAASPGRRASGPAGPAGLSRAVAGAISWIITDNQNARPYEGEPAWTTSGEPECRNKGSRYSNPAVKTQIGNETGRKWITHHRRRDYLADHETRVVLRLAAGQGLSLDELAQALDRPARPLFIGRKPCMPSARLVQAGPRPTAPTSPCNR
ncbi:type I-E CRISPR-associated protein Cas5/CasD [Paracoccus aminovorans]|uniref:type I-E CRISPR-associated protein Cas5/CasD n=1 Tax=Paracoccus aminovorans TaxID=34004 RepID=UPI003461ABAE